MKIAIGSSGALSTALSLAGASGRAIRAYRKGGFSEPEHRIAQALAEIWSARLDATDELSFEPGLPGPDPVRVELPGREPLLPLVMATAAALGARGAAAQIVFVGSTHAADGATFEVAASSFVALMRRVGVELSVTLDMAGFVPRGGGVMKLAVAPGSSSLSAIVLDHKDPLQAVTIFSGAPGSVPSHVQQRQAARARSGVAAAGVEPTVQLVKLPSRKAGSVVAVTGRFGELPITVSAVSRRGMSVEAVGAEAAAEFRRAASVPWVLPPVLFGPLLVALVFANGSSVLTTWKLPPDIAAQVELARELAQREIVLEGKPGQPGRIVIELAHSHETASY